MSRIHNKSKFSVNTPADRTQSSSPLRPSAPPTHLARCSIFLQMSEQEEQLYKLLRILDKEKQYRSKMDLDFVTQVLQEIPFFKERSLSEQELYDVATCVKHQYFDPGQDVIRIGEVGEKFYIILRGSVGVHIPPDKTARRLKRDQSGKQSRSMRSLGETPSPLPPRTDSRATSNVSQRTQSRSVASQKKTPAEMFASREVETLRKAKASLDPTRLRSPLLKLQKELMSQSVRQSLENLKRDRSHKRIEQLTRQAAASRDTSSDRNSRFLSARSSKSSLASAGSDDEQEDNEVAVLESGSSFGELALLKNKLRAATVRCKEPSHFAVIERKDYKKVLLRIEQKRFDSLTDFLQALPYFATWARHSIAKLQFFFEKQEYSRGQQVFAEGDLDSHIYLIQKGEFTSFAYLKPTKEREEHNLESLSSSRKNIKRHVLLAHKRSALELEDGQWEESGGEGGSTAKKTKFEQRMEKLGYLGPKGLGKKTKIALMSEGQLFGEEYFDSFVEEVERTYSVQCSSSAGTLLRIKRKVFQEKVERNEKTWEMLMQTTERREQNLVEKVYSNLDLKLEKKMKRIAKEHRQWKRIARDVEERDKSPHLREEEGRGISPMRLISPSPSPSREMKETKEKELTQRGKRRSADCSSRLSMTSPHLGLLKAQLQQKGTADKGEKITGLMRFKLKESASREKLMRRVDQPHQEAESFLKTGENMFLLKTMQPQQTSKLEEEVGVTGGGNMKIEEYLTSLEPPQISKEIALQKGGGERSNTERTPHYTLTGYDKAKDIVSSYVTERQERPQLPVIVAEEKRVNQVNQMTGYSMKDPANYSLPWPLSPSQQQQQQAQHTPKQSQFMRKKSENLKRLFQIEEHKRNQSYNSYNSQRTRLLHSPQIFNTKVSHNLASVSKSSFVPHIDSSRSRLSSLKASKAVSPEPFLMERSALFLEDDKSFLLNKTSTAMRTPSPLETSFQRSGFMQRKKQSTDSGHSSMRKASIGGARAGSGSNFGSPAVTLSFSRREQSMSFRRERGEAGPGYAKERTPCSPQFIAAVLAQRAAAGGGVPASVMPSFPSVVTVTKIPFESKRGAFAKQRSHHGAQTSRPLQPVAIPQPAVDRGKFGDRHAFSARRGPPFTQYSHLSLASPPQ